MWLNKNPQPDWIKLCIESTVIHNPTRFVYVTDNNLVNLLPHLRPEVWEISHIVAASEYIRFALIATYGGIWLDADALVMHPVDFIFREIEQGKVFLLREQLREEEFYDPGFFGAPIHHPTILRAQQLFDERLNNGERDFPWVIGGELLNQAIRETNPEKFVIHSSVTHPFTCLQQDKLMQENPPHPSTLINVHAPVIVFAAEMFRRFNYGNLQNRSKQEIMESNTVISQLIHLSRQNSISQWVLE